MRSPTCYGSSSGGQESDYLLMLHSIHKDIVKSNSLIFVIFNIYPRHVCGFEHSGSDLFKGNS